MEKKSYLYNMKNIYTNYYITEDGKLFNSKKQMKTYKGDKYEKCVLKINDKPTMKYIHRLVAEAFIPNPENKRTVNHMDGNRFNNHVSNLEWATYSENSRHAWKNGLYDNVLNRDYTGINNPNYKHGKRVRLK